MMEKLKSISLLIAKLKIAYPYYFKEMTKEEVAMLMSLYQDELSNYSDEVLSESVKNIIRNSKYMPTISELIEECEKHRSIKKSYIIELMVKDGYFKSPIEIDKAYHFLEEDIIPEWFKKDMAKYGYQERELTTSNLNLIGD